MMATALRGASVEAPVGDPTQVYNQILLGRSYWDLLNAGGH